MTEKGTKLILRHDIFSGDAKFKKKHVYNPKSIDICYYFVYKREQ